MTTQGKVTDLTFHHLVANMTEEQTSVLANVVGDVIDGTGQRGLLDVKAHLHRTIKGGKAAWKASGKDNQKVVKGLLKDFKQSKKNAKKTVKSGGYTSINDRLAARKAAEQE